LSSSARAAMQRCLVYPCMLRPGGPCLVLALYMPSYIKIIFLFLVHWKIKWK
jgi:hypothetical protein